MCRVVEMDETKKYALIQQAKLVRADLYYIDRNGAEGWFGNYIRRQSYHRK